MGLREEFIMGAGLDIYKAMVPFLDWLLLLVFIIFIPLGLFDRTKRFSGQSLIITSYIFGLALWLWTAAIALSLAGWFWFVLGIGFFGIGVSIVAFFASAFVGYYGVSISIFGVWVIVIGCYFTGVHLVEKADDIKYQKKKALNNNIRDTFL